MYYLWLFNKDNKQKKFKDVNYLSEILNSLKIKLISELKKAST